MAAAWPWRFFETIPGTGVPLSLAIAIPLLPAGLYRLFRTERSPWPFDLFWPAAAMIVLGLAGAASWAYFGACFLGVLMLAQSRETALRALWLTGLSGAGAALLSLLAQAGLLFPTVFPVDSELAIAFAYRAGDAWLTLALCAGTASVLVFAPELARPVRFSAALAAGLCLAGLGTITFYGGLPAVAPLGAGAGLLAHVPAALCLWLLARIGARFIVGCIESEKQGLCQASEFSSETGLSLFSALPAGLMALAIVLVPGEVPPSAGVLAGLLAACVLPQNLRPPAASLPLWIAPAVAALAFLHAAAVFPVLGTHEPRDYAAKASLLFEHGEDEALEALVERVEAIAPEERRSDYWLAKLRLRQKCAKPAAMAFAHAMKEGKHPLLPPPAKGEVDDFVARLRDLCSAQPPEECGLAYERALVAAGDTDSALAALDLHPTAACGGLAQSVPEMASRVADHLGDPGLAEVLAQRSPERLCGLLALIGPR